MREFLVKQHQKANLLIVVLTARNLRMEMKRCVFLALVYWLFRMYCQLVTTAECNLWSIRTTSIDKFCALVVRACVWLPYIERNRMSGRTKSSHNLPKWVAETEEIEHDMKLGSVNLSKLLSGPTSTRRRWLRKVKQSSAELTKDGTTNQSLIHLFQALLIF